MFRIVGFGLLLLLASVRLQAQSWDAVTKIEPGTQVTVEDSSGKDHRGKLASVTVEAISIDTGRGQEAIERTRVRRVQARAPSRRLRNALIGAGIGLAVGAIADNTIGTYLRNEVGEGTGGRVLTYIGPAGIFGAIGASLPARRTVYKSK